MKVIIILVLLSILLGAAVWSDYIQADKIRSRIDQIIMTCGDSLDGYNVGLLKETAIDVRKCQARFIFKRDSRYKRAVSLIDTTAHVLDANFDKVNEIGSAMAETPKTETEKRQAESALRRINFIDHSPKRVSRS